MPSRAPAPPPGSPLDAEDLRARVQKALDAFVAARLPELDGVSGELAPLIEALGDLLAGGKRLRPAFCYWAWRGEGGEDAEPIVAAATSLELLHASAIVHDDVMDGSDTRRGMPAVHRRLTGMHRAEGWLGSADRFGMGAAILLGDLCLAWSDQLLTGSGLPPAAVERARPAFDRMRTELMAGQYLDLLEQARGGGSTERAMRVLRFKSAKYTVEGPLHLGARLAGATDELVAGYSAYGLPLGEAFQLRDDVLGVFGDPAETGKPAGDDLREGKRTVLIATTLELATPQQATTVRGLLGDPALDAAGVTELQDVIRATGALDRIESLIAALTGQALAALDRSPVAEDARQVLADLAVAATARER